MTLESLDNRVTQIEQELKDAFAVVKYILTFLSVLASGILITLVTMK